MIAGLGGLYYVMDYACGVWSNDAFGDQRLAGHRARYLYDLASGSEYFCIDLSSADCTFCICTSRPEWITWNSRSFTR